eukprot:4220574-Pyramimonas_sp.AAC.1
MTAEMAAMLESSPFQTTNAKQLVEALSENGWNATLQFEELVAHQNSTFKTSQMCEEAIGHEKNDPAGRANKRHRRPASCTHAAIKAGIIDARHQFDNTPTEVPL